MADKEITCRVKSCKLVLLYKNYKTHLERNHPDENPGDLSPFGQQKLNFGSRKRSVENNLTSDNHDNSIKVQKTNDSELAESVEVQKDANDGQNFPNTQDDKFTEILSVVNQLQQQVSELRNEIKGPSIEEKHESQSSTKTPEVDDEAFGDTIKKWKLARSLDDLEELGFHYNPIESILKCTVCFKDSDDIKHIKSNVGIFSYSSEFERDFYGQKFTLEFSNLKGVVRGHLTTKTHSNSLRSKQEKEEQDRIILNNNVKAGMSLGRYCMKNYILGRPYTDFESDVLTGKLNGVFVGDLNHSKNFPAHLRPFVDEVVTSKVKNFLTSLKQTGHLPPLAISADKGTYKHRSRQFLMVCTVNPDGENLIEVISCGQPVVDSGSKGLDLVKLMKKGFDVFCIVGSQIKSAVFDGVYFHCNVAEHMKEVYDIDPSELLFTWDGLYKTSLVDKHLGEKPEFDWLTKDTESCQTLFTLFNWGANYEKFREASSLWKLSIKNLVTFSATRFANSRRKVYINIHHSFAPIITCLEEAIMEEQRLNLKKETSENANKIKEKAAKCREVKGKIMNVRFQLTLSSFQIFMTNLEEW